MTGFRGERDRGQPRCEMDLYSTRYDQTRVGFHQKVEFDRAPLQFTPRRARMPHMLEDALHHRHPRSLSSSLRWDLQLDRFHLSVLGAIPQTFALWQHPDLSNVSSFGLERHTARRPKCWSLTARIRVSLILRGSLATLTSTKNNT